MENEEKFILKCSVKQDGILVHGLHFWTAKNGHFYPAFWNSHVINYDKTKIAEDPTVTLEIGRKLYVGLNTGTIEILNEDGRTELNASRFPPLFPRSEEFDRDVRSIRAGFRKIRGFASLDGSVYDASSAGLFETGTDFCLDDRQIHSAGVYQGRLFFIPAGPKYDGDWKSRFEIRREQSEAGDMIEAITKRSLFPKAAPYSKRDYKQSDYTLSGDDLFILHKGLGKRIEIKSLSGSKKEKEFTVLGCSGFVVDEKKNIVYDIRLWPNGREALTDSRKSCEEAGASVYSPRRGERITSAIASRSGILMSVYDESKDQTRVASHTDPEKDLLRTHGNIRFMKS